ncbi:MAG: thioredoxin domain-containing protein [Jiangellales bacterium]
MSSKPSKDDRRARSEQMKAEREAAARTSERRTRLLVAVAVLAAIALIAVAVVGSQSGTGDNAAVPAGVEPPGGGAPYGEDSAPVVMDEWIDFSCPACATFTAALGETISEQVAAGELKVIYHPVSFINAGSARAANALGCAVDQGSTNEFYDAVFAAQGEESGDGVTNEELVSIGASVGIESPEFSQCVNDGTYDGWADNLDVAQVEAGVTGTPTIFLNGELTDLPAFEPQALLDAIEAAKAAG